MTLRPFLRGLLRGLALRCPRCGAGRMSPSLWTVARMRDACPACGVTFHPSRGEWSGALMFAQGIYFALGLLGLFALLLGGARLWTLLAWIALSCALLPLATYRNVKGAWVGAMWGAGPWASDVVGAQAPVDGEEAEGVRGAGEERAEGGRNHGN